MNLNPFGGGGFPGLPSLPGLPDLSSIFGGGGGATIATGPGGGLGFDPTQQDQDLQGLLSSLMTTRGQPQSSGLYGGGSGQQSYLGGFGLI